MNKLITLFKKHPDIVRIVILFGVIWLAFGAMLNLYYWQDDYATIFKVQHLEGRAGNFGEGIYDRSSLYRFVATIVYPSYLLFGINAAGHYFSGIILYFLATISAYYFLKVITKSDNKAFIGALIYASGYIGSESVWRISTSLHTSHMLIFLQLTFAVYILSFTQKSKRLFLYLLAIFLYVYTMETGYIRAHGILLCILALEFLLNFSWIKSILRVAPFIFLYTKWYENGSTGSWLEYFKIKIISEGDYSILLSPLKVLKNIIIPDAYPFPLLLFLLILLSILWIKRKNKHFLLGIALMLAPYAVPYFTNRGEVFESTHRYLTASLIGFALFATTFLHEFLEKKKYLYILVLSLILGSHIILQNEQINFMVQNQSKPSKDFYKSLTFQLPQLPIGSSLYFDVKRDALSNRDMNNALAVGSMPVMTSIAVHYGVDRYDLSLPETFQELLGFISEGKVEKEKLYTFFYRNDGGLVDTTKTTQEALFGEKKEFLFDDFTNLNLKFSSPLLLEFDLIADLDSRRGDNENDEKSNLSEYLDYISAKDNYYQTAEATASSQWRYHEIFNIIDNNVETSWMSHRLEWHYNPLQSVIVDLKRVHEVGGVKLVFAHPPKSPTSYTYECSSDSVNWRKLQIENLNRDRYGALDKVSQSFCRYIRMEITGTEKQDEPQIAEIEILNPKFLNLDFSTAQKIDNDPFSFVKNDADRAAVDVYLRNHGLNSKICYSTDKFTKFLEENCDDIRIKLGKNSFEHIIPQGGTILEKIEIKSPGTLKVKASNVRVSTLSYDELKKKNYIIDYSEN